MISLFLDTCNSNLIVSLIQDNKIIYKRIEETDKNLSVRLLPIIEECFKECNKSINDIDRVYIANGPGSFTGVRIGVTVAKVIAYSLNKKIIPISELQILASIPNEKNYIVPIIDARRGFVYSSIYDNNLNVVYEDNYISLQELLDYINTNYNIDDFIFVSYDNIDIENIKKPDIDLLKIISKHENDEGVNCHKVNPNYLKKTEAEEKRSDNRN